ncbi:ATP-binding protein [Reticulomyxa filosa]|uniref:ATP-binding protein n=1 Tax=Reticulomyxa filosa TaxID=46433 RepID=X6NL36_RETFI|nr:ATP-binding protein [Reticulomyxa filosa]|eukprot:ETO26633.1 ATP-binding protein [Reticulomyxa filosa]
MLSLASKLLSSYTSLILPKLKSKIYNLQPFCRIKTNYLVLFLSLHEAKQESLLQDVATRIINVPYEDLYENFNIEKKSGLSKIFRDQQGLPEMNPHQALSTLQLLDQHQVRALTQNSTNVSNPSSNDLNFGYSLMSAKMHQIKDNKKFRLTLNTNFSIKPLKSFIDNSLKEQQDYVGLLQSIIEIQLKMQKIEESMRQNNLEFSNEQTILLNQISALETVHKEYVNVIKSNTTYEKELNNAQIHSIQALQQTELDKKTNLIKQISLFFLYALKIIKIIVFQNLQNINKQKLEERNNQRMVDEESVNHAIEEIRLKCESGSTEINNLMEKIQSYNQKIEKAAVSEKKKIEEKKEHNDCQKQKAIQQVLQSLIHRYKLLFCSVFILTDIVIENRFQAKKEVKKAISKKKTKGKTKKKVTKKKKNSVK